MHTNKERIDAMHRRAEELERARRRRVFAAAGSASVALCLIAVIALGLFMPALTGTGTVSLPAEAMRASLIVGSEALGYVVTGIAAFLLGISTTIFCYRLKKWRDGGDRGERS